GLNRCLPNDFMTALELAEELIVQVVSVSEENQSWIFHCWMFDDAACIEEHRQALARTLRVPDDTNAAISFFSALHFSSPIGSFSSANAVFCCRADCLVDGCFDRMELMIASDQLMNCAAIGIV